MKSARARPVPDVSFWYGVLPYRQLVCPYVESGNGGYSFRSIYRPFEMGVPFICFGLAIRTTDNPALINRMCYLSPFLSLFFISVVLREAIMPTTIVGLVLIVGGLVYNEYFAGRRLKGRLQGK